MTAPPSARLRAADRRTARWLFPASLGAINLFVPAFAVAGLLLLGTAADPDLFVLALPMQAGDPLLSLFVFLGGLSAGSALLAAGAARTARPALRRRARLGSLGSLAVGTYFLIHDLGRPARFHHMLRVAKPPSPMSMGTWLLTAYGHGLLVRENAGRGETLPGTADLARPPASRG